MSKSLRIAAFTSFLTLFAVFALSAVAQESKPDVRIVFSLNRLCQSEAAQEIAQTAEFKNLLQTVSKRIDSEYAKVAQKPDFPKEPVEFLLDKIRTASGKQDINAQSVAELAIHEIDLVMIDLMADFADPNATSPVVSALFRFEPEEVFGLLQFAKEGSDYKLVKEDGNLRLYSGKPQDGKTPYFGYCRYPDQNGSLVAAGDDAKRVEAALRDVEGLKTALKDDQPIFSFVLDKSFFEKLRASDHYQRAKASDDFGAKIAVKLVEGIEKCRLIAKEEKGVGSAGFQIMAVSPTNAKDIKDLVEGGLALIKMAAANGDVPQEARDAMALLDALKVAQNESRVSISADFSKEQIVEMAKKACREAADRIPE